MDVSKLIAALRATADEVDALERWNYDTIENKAAEAVSGALRSPAGRLASGENAE